MVAPATDDAATLDVLNTRPTIQALEGGLRPIERFAVRVWEDELGSLDYEALAIADMEQTSTLAVRIIPIITIVFLGMSDTSAKFLLLHLACTLAVSEC